MSWSKGRIKKIKNSPAVKLIKKTADDLGQKLLPGADSDPGPNHPANAGRSTNSFIDGVVSHLPTTSEHDALFDNATVRELGLAKSGNVVPITDAHRIRNSRKPNKPEGY